MRMRASATLSLGVILWYVASLPLLWPSLGVVPGGKVAVLADLAFVTLLGVVLSTSARRLLPVQRDVLIVSLVVLCAIVISAVGSGAGRRALPDILRVGYSMSALAFFAHYRFTTAERRLVIQTWLVTAVVVAVVGILAYGAVTRFGAPMSQLASANSPNLGAGFVRIASTLGPSALALYLLTAVVLCIARLGDSRTVRGNRRLLWMACGVFLIAAALSFSRSLIGLVVAMALMGYLSRERVPILWRVRHWLACGAACLVVLGVLVTVWAIVPIRLERDLDHQTLSVELNMQKNAYAVIHAAGLRMFRAKPLVGVGPGTFGDRFWDFTTLAERRTSWPAILAAPCIDPHSSWFGWAAKGGIIALSGWIVVYGWLLAQLLRRSPHEDAFSLRRLIGIGLVGGLLNGFHVEITHLKFLWAFLGLGVGCRPRHGVRGGAQAEGEAGGG